MANPLIFIFISFIPLSFSLLLAQGSIISDRDLTLSTPQKISLDKLKNMMEPLLKQEYMKTEAYLVKWLRGANFDPNGAAKKIMADVQWRKEQQMDKIHEESWEDFRYLFEYNILGVDKEDQPLLVMDMGHWDFRQAMISGQRNRLERYIYRLLNEAAIAVRKAQAEGKHVTRTNLVLNLDGYNTIQHGCIPCVTFYLLLASALDSHFPELFDQMIMVNVPSIFEVVFTIVKPAFPLELQKSIVIFGTNKREWKDYLSDIIDQDQLPIELGGTKDTGFGY